MHEQLDGQTFLVTGANRGLGAQTTVDLAGLGATVYAAARDPSSLQELPDNIIPVPLDVTDEASIEGALAGMDVLNGVVNNAGVGDWHGSVLHTVETELLDKVLATNLRGPMLVAKHALPKLLEQRGSRIVNVSSGMGGLEGMGGGNPAYRVSKTGLNGLTTYLHGEYSPRGLIANSVCPGWVRTDMGGPNAHRTLEEGADTIVWLCQFEEGDDSGHFWRDRKIIPW